MKGFPKIGHYTAMKRRGLLPNQQCFIATAVYGSPFAPEVKTLRQWRDQRLTKTPIGRSFISIYYKYSPEIARYIEHRQFLRWLIRKVLDYIVKKICA